MARSEVATTDIPPTWTLTRLADVADRIGSGATPRGGNAVYLPRRARWALVRSQNVFDRHFNAEGLAFISDDDAEQLAGVALEAGDVLLNITGDGVTFARACMVPSEVLPACVNQHVVRIRCNRRRCDPGYLLGFLTHPLTKHYIESFNAGGSRRAITKGHIESFEIPLPPLPEQRAIAGVLGALDDKIEVNRKTARVLEGIARAVFTSWFVDFDPVRLRAASHPGSVALFPTRLVDSPIGEVPKIPEGWSVGRLDEIIVLQRGFDLPKEQRRPGSVPVIAASGFNGGHDTAMVKGPGVTTGRSGVLGNVFLVQEDFWPLNTSLYVKQYTNSNPYHAYFVLQRIDFKMFNAGSAVPTLNRNHVHNLATVIPPKAVTTAFEQIVAPMFHRLRSLERQSATLAALRDALLPQLISGELRIADAEKIVGRAL